jgi:hypothetical protein
MFGKLLTTFWADECGAVIASEYLMLGTIVAAGTTSGLVAMRDSVVNEYKDFGQSVRDIRMAHMPATLKANHAAPTPAPTAFAGYGYEPPVQAVPTYSFNAP